MYEYTAKVINIVDGDTYDLDIDLGFHIHIHERVRILGLDTPECRGNEKELGKTVKNFVNEILLNRNVILHSEKELSPTTDSFGRWLVHIICHYNSELKSITDILSDLGVNKKQLNYSPENVEKLKSLLIMN